MSEKNHTHVLAFLDAFHVGGPPDFAALAGYFADDGSYQPLVPATDKIIGRAAIAAALEKQYQTYYECECEIHASAAMGRFVFTDGQDESAIAEGVCAVFEMNDAGEIASWREYWDTGDVMQQMGISAEVLAAAM